MAALPARWSPRCRRGDHDAGDRRPLDHASVARQENQSRQRAERRLARSSARRTCGSAMRVSANISSEYGSALDKQRDAARPPAGSPATSSAAPACATPMGTMTTAPTIVPSAVVRRRARRPPSGRTRYRAPSRRPPPSAKTTPAGEDRMPDDPERQERDEPERRQRHPQIIDRAMRSRDRDRQGSRELQGDGDAERNAGQRRIEEKIHASHREPVNQMLRASRAVGRSRQGRHTAASIRARECRAAAPWRRRPRPTGNSPLTSAAPI